MSLGGGGLGDIRVVLFGGITIVLDRLLTERFNFGGAGGGGGVLTYNGKRFDVSALIIIVF